MKRIVFLVVALFLLRPILGLAQGHAQGCISLTNGQAVAGASVRACQEPASGNPCTPAAPPIFSDWAQSVPLANPFTTDKNGCYSFYGDQTVAYHLQIVYLSSPGASSVRDLSYVFMAPSGTGGGGINGSQYQGVYLAALNTAAADPRITSNATSWTSTHSAGIFGKSFTSTGTDSGILIPDGGTEAANRLTMQGGVLYNNTTPVGGTVAGTLGQPIYGTGSSVSSVPTELAVDQFFGADVCIKYTAAEAALPSTGGVIVFSARNYAACSAPLTITKDHVTIRGAGMGNWGLASAATKLNFAAGVSGIISAKDTTCIENMLIESASTGSGSDNGITIGGGSSCIKRVIVQHFGGNGVLWNDNTDLWRMENVYADHNFGDGFHLSAACFDENVGFGSTLSATSNGGIGYNLQCGGGNYFLNTHAANNAGGAWLVNSTYNFIVNAYVELGVGSSFIYAATTGYNQVLFSAFGQPSSIIDNGVPGTNTVRYDAFGGTDGQYPAVDTFSLTGPPQESPLTFYSFIAGANAFGPHDLLIRDRLNAVNIYDYVPSKGHLFFGPVSFTPGSVSFGQNATPAVVTSPTNYFTLFGPATVPANAFGFQFSANPPTPGQALIIGSPTGNIYPITYGSSGGGGTIANTLLLLKGDNAGNALAANSGDVVGLFSGCSGSKYLGADGACHLATGITNSAGANVIPKSDGSNLVPSNLGDNGTAVTSAVPVNAPSVNLGTSPPTACSPSSGCWAAGESSAGGTPTAGVDYMRADSVTHTWRQSLNGAAETALGTGTVTSVAVGNLSPLFTSNVATASTTPTVTYTLSTAGAHTAFMNNTGSTGTPAFARPACADLSDASAFCNGTLAATLTAGALANGMTATTQSPGDNTTKLATDAYVVAAVASGVGTGFNNGAGTGYQDAAAISAPSNPGSGCRLYIDSGTGELAGKKSSGASCMPSAGAAAFSSLTGGTNTGAAMVVGSGATLGVNYNAASLAAPLTGTLMQLGQANGTAARMEVDAFANTAFFTAVRANGTAASPSGLSSNDQMGGFNVWGHNGTSVVGPQATFRAFASQTWTASHLGTYATVATTPNNSTTLTEVIRFENDGGITVPGVTGGDKGTGTINAQGLYINGVSVASAKCDPSDPTQYCFVEEFPNGAVTSGQIGTNSWVLNTIGTAGSATIPTSAWPHLGLISLNTNAAATQGQGESLAMGGAGGPLGDLATNTNWSYGGIFQLQETTTSVFRIGLMNQANVARPTSFIGLRYDVNSPLSAQSITSIVCTTTACTVTDSGGTLTNPGQSITISGATCPTRTVNGTQVMTKLISATQWIFAQSGAAETCGTPGTATTIPDTNLKVYAQNLNSTNATVVDTGVAADTGWHNIQISSAVAGTFVFVLDGGSPITINTNGPSQSLITAAILAVDSTVVAAKSVYLDRVSMYMSGLTR